MQNNHYNFIDKEKSYELDSENNTEFCSHIEMAHRVHPSADGCEDCLQTGDSWVHLRICLTCGHVGCCDSSRNKHATAHFHNVGHPLIKSLERNENWAWCYVEKRVL